MLRLNDVIDKVKSYHASANTDMIKKAYVYAARVHSNQKRKSGDPYLTHPLAVSYILAQLRLDEASICTGLLHDTIEDTVATKEEISNIFGNDIANLVDGVTKLAHVKFQSNEQKFAENFRKMLVAMSKDIRVLLVKLADRLHNMRTLEYMRIHKQEIIAKETLDIYAPLSHRLGLGNIKTELEDLSFKFLKKHDYQELKDKIGLGQQEREKFIKLIANKITNSLNKSQINNFDICGRPKHLWSIYRKMINKELNFEEVHDIIAFRIIVDNVSQCYGVLGHIHSVFKPVPGKFKDYIAMPKPNGYQSLHTTLLIPGGEHIEIQIRTKQMHEIAENGIAAHWKYKESLGKYTLNLEKQTEFTWLKQLMDWQKELSDPNEFIDSVKVDLFSEEVYVFTPRGDVIELPYGATPVDFAFNIHSDIGMCCIGAKVNNKIVPLQYKLNNGDTVSIITQKEQNLKKGWLKFVKTSKAKTKIRSVLRQLERQKSKEIGMEILEKEFKKYGANLAKNIKNNKIADAFKENKYRNNDEVIIAVGYGKLSPNIVAKKVLPSLTEKQNQIESAPSKIGQLFSRFTKKSSSGVKIDGINNIMVHYAKCCNPIKGDSIIGFVTRGRGLTIHRQNCPKILELDPQRKVDVTWETQSKSTRIITIKAYTDDRHGLLAEMSAIFNGMNINIYEANCKVLGNARAVNTFKCALTDLDQLKNLMRKLQMIKGIHSVERVK